MSAGPIKQWREGHKVASTSTAAKDRVCFMKLGAGRAYCGRRPQVSVDDWKRVTCADCGAAYRADIEAQAVES
jgi:type IV pilus biogenesis protein CpaD/CtpE